MLSSTFFKLFITVNYIFICIMYFEFRMNSEDLKIILQLKALIPSGYFNQECVR